MHTRNVKTAAQESSRKMGEKPCHTRSSLLISQKLRGRVGRHGIQQPCCAEKYRRSHPEKMSFSYGYALSRGVDKQFCHINVAEADHFKQFVRLIERAGFNIQDNQL